jgi:hypothetical protein
MAWFRVTGVAVSGAPIEFGIRGDATPRDWEEICRQHGLPPGRWGMPTTSGKVVATELVDLDTLISREPPG